MKFVVSFRAYSRMFLYGEMNAAITAMPFLHSEPLAEVAVSIADASISQKTFDEASSVVNHALPALTITPAPDYSSGKL
jgi:hypothetical protein